MMACNNMKLSWEDNGNIYEYLVTIIFNHQQWDIMKISWGKDKKWGNNLQTHF